jgi:hypothetical protein
VFSLFDKRLVLMLEQVDPLFDNWDQDETAVKDAYDKQDPLDVASAIQTFGGAVADRFESVTGDQWLRSGRRSDGAEFTVDTFSRYLLHDPVHHLFDVITGYEVIDRSP